MFIFDKPIETEKDDFLGRKRFSQHLGKALLDWKEKESLVIAVYGEWGSGKSSVINLAREGIDNSDHDNKPTVIEFNPWVFSEEDNLGEHFFNEVAKELEIRNDTDKDKKIAKKLKFYASLLNLAPDKKILAGLSSKALIVLGLLGFSSSQVTSWANLPESWIINGVAIGSLFLILIVLFKEYLVKFASYLEKKADYYSKSVSAVKREIKKELVDRKRKLVIVIDDIDRLNQSEIRKIFRLIRVNADFPNTIYLLAFERKIIEKNLEEQVGVSGKDYLDKIIQVSFDVPFAKSSKIYAFLFKELDRILSVLPESAHKYFEQNDPYWTNIYHSGFKDFFRNIRDVKRFASSLEFNISQMYQSGVMEVNPIDFMAIEAIRIFVPDLYIFMRDKKELFTATDRDGSGSRENNPRKNEIEKALNELPEDLREPATELIKRLFPQIEGVLQHGYSTYGNDWQSNWSNELRVCATNNFDSYFTLIPGGDEEELSQFEIEEILRKTGSAEEFEEIIRDYIEKGKIRKVLQRIQDFTSDQNRIPQDSVKNVVQVIFDISDDLPEDRMGMFDFGIDMDLMRIIFQLLKREEDKNKNYSLLKEAIIRSKGLFGPVDKISLESSRKDKGASQDDFIVPEDKIEELQELCVDKIIGWDKNELLPHRKLLFILYRWKEWDKSDNWKKFIDEIENDDEKLLAFTSKFISKTQSQALGDYGIKVTNKFGYKSYGDFFDLGEMKAKFEEMKKQNTQLYKDNSETIDLFLNDFDKKDDAHY